MPDTPEQREPTPDQGPKSWSARVRRVTLGTTRVVVSVALFLMRRDASLLAAGLAFFAMVSLAPFIVLAVALGGLVFGAAAARAELYASLSEEVGPKVAEFVVGLAQNAKDEASLSVATIVGVTLLLWSSTRLFMEARRALHAMWQIPPPLENGFKGAVLAYLKGRLVAAISTLVFGALFLVFLGARFVIEAVKREVGDGNGVEVALGLWSVIEPLVSLGLASILVLLVFRFLPDRGPRGWPLFFGAVATACALILGRHLVGLYVTAGAIDTAYGAAGSAVVFLIWAYWSSLAFLFGARLAWALEELWLKHRDAGSIADDRRLGGLPGA
jgi:membrane protein